MWDEGSFDVTSEEKLKFVNLNAVTQLTDAPLTKYFFNISTEKNLSSSHFVWLHFFETKKGEKLFFHQRKNSRRCKEKFFCLHVFSFHIKLLWKIFIWFIFIQQKEDRNCEAKNWNFVTISFRFSAPPILTSWHCKLLFVQHRTPWTIPSAYAHVLCFVGHLSHLSHSTTGPQRNVTRHTTGVLLVRLDFLCNQTKFVYPLIKSSHFEDRTKPEHNFPPFSFLSLSCFFSLILFSFCMFIPSQISF